MDFSVFPPEINSGLMYAGAGVGPLMEAGSAWSTLSQELSAAAQAYRSVIGNLAIAWKGPTAARMMAAVQPYLVWLETAAADAELTAVQATVAANAYSVAFAATIPPPMIAANRAQLLALVATNWFGQNTPAIAANEAEYAQFWAQDAAAMNTYATSSQAATTALPQFTQAPQTTNGSTPAAATGPGGWLDNSTTIGQLIQAVISSGFPVDVAALFTNFIGLQQVAASNIIRNNPPITVTPTPVPEPVLSPVGSTPVEAPKPVQAATGAGGSIRGLSVPPSWAQPQKPEQSKLTVEAPTKDRYQAAIPAIPFMPVTTAGRSAQGRVREDPEYGHVSKVIPPRHPAGG